jgi:diguanylate cyclase (GGDEF)-like protein/PAS domain S-box-containing protein
MKWISSVSRWLETFFDSDKITRLKSTEAKLNESEEKFRSAFNSSAIGMAIVSTEGNFLQVNKAMIAILGYTEEELVNSNFETIIISQDLPKAKQQRQALIEGVVASYETEERYHHKNGKTVWLHLTYSLIHSIENIPLYFVVQVQDITTHKKSEQELAYQAYYDSLTGLANRAQLEHSVKHLIDQSKRYHHKFAVFFLDLDRFKHINDTFGHDTGDKLLITVAERLRNAVRKTDIVARLGGDEFVVVLSDINSFDQSAIFADKILSVLCQSIRIRENDFFITTSIGISVYPVDGNDYQTLLRNADFALYQAKENGRNNYQFCTLEMGKQMQERLNLEAALKKAVINDEFQLYYQPQIETLSKKVVGLEAFIRWKSGQYGDVPPQKMLPIAEEIGLIVPLTDWMMQTAFFQLRTLIEAGVPSIDMAINLSARQFLSDQLKNWIVANLNAAHISPERIKLEIKESLLLQMTDSANDKLKELRKMGIKVSIDDFGTGYSSLSYLQNDMVDCIKIDDSLTRAIADNPKSRQMIIAIIQLAKNLGISVIAEGVETQEQSDFLTENGCDILQGYYISKPLSQDDLMQFFNVPVKKREPETV